LADASASRALPATLLLQLLAVGEEVEGPAAATLTVRLAARLLESFRGLWEPVMLCSMDAKDGAAVGEPAGLLLLEGLSLRLLEENETEAAACWLWGDRETERGERETERVDREAERGEVSSVGISTATFLRATAAATAAAACWLRGLLAADEGDSALSAAAARLAALLGFELTAVARSTVEDAGASAAARPPAAPAGCVGSCRIDRRTRKVLTHGCCSSCSTVGRAAGSLISAPEMNRRASSDIVRG